MAQGWSADEIELALGNQDFKAYQNSGGTRSKHAYNARRYRMGVPSGHVPVSEGPPKLPDSGEYDDIETYYQAVKTITAAKINLVDGPTAIEWTAPDNKWTGIVFIGDIHIGGLIDYSELEHDLSLVEATDGLFCLGMGDYSERFGETGKLQHAMAGDTVPGADDQELLILHILGRCSKWLGVLAGNHDDFGSGEGVRRLAKHLACPYVSQAGASFRVNAGVERYVLYLKHQYTGASRISTSNEGRRFWTEWADFENADVTVLAHLHQPDTHQVERKGQTVSHLRGGTYKTIDPWARRGGYSPAYGPSLILLNPDNHEVIPFHGPQWRRGVEMLGHLRKGAE